MTERKVAESFIKFDFSVIKHGKEQTRGEQLYNNNAGETK
jgi:hypothetical protein